MGRWQRCVRALAGASAVSAASGCVFWDMESWIGTDTGTSDGGLGDSGRTDGGEGMDGSCAKGTGYAAIVLQDDPLGYWRLEDSLGAKVAHDSSCHGHDAVVQGGVTFGAPGQVGNGARFDGSGSLSLGSLFGFLPNAFSVEAWINPTTIATASGPTYRYVLSRYSGERDRTLPSGDDGAVIRSP